VSAADINARLRSRGVAIRPFAAVPHAGECIRVTIGPWEKMEEFLRMLTEVL
jgi:histidinol-phosphate/aromatic aminotransferase/cobyric acid decarboxylase-like protein